MTDSSSDMVSITKAAQMLNKSKSQVYYGIKQGKIPSTQIKGKKFVPRSFFLKETPVTHKDAPIEMKKDDKGTSSNQTPSVPSAKSETATIPPDLVKTIDKA